MARRSFLKVLTALPLALNSVRKALSDARPVGVQTLWGVVRESFTGAWQRNVTVEPLENLLAFSAVYSCISLISNDISKLAMRLIERNERTQGVWAEVDRNSPYIPVIRKPNRYQTRVQFLSQWIVSKLIYGNTYVLKSRDQRGIVTALYILDPRLVTPLVANDGSVWYRLGTDFLSGITSENTLPASEIIHDRGVCLFHPLIGVPPIYACGISTTQGVRIQNNSEKFFQNMSMPSGQLTSPHTIDDITAARLKIEFEKGTSGPNIGRLFVGGDGLKYEAFGMIPPDQAQLIEQLKWTGEDVARCFLVPLYKIGGEQPKFSNASQANDDYYKQCLQNPIEAIEILMEEGLGLTPLGMSVELDLKGLLRMDPMARAEAAAKRLQTAQASPNEERFEEDRPPMPGGNELWIQEQNWPLSILAQRPPPSPATPTPPAASSPSDDKPSSDDSEDAPPPPAEDRTFRKYLKEVEAFEDFAAQVREELRTHQW